MFLGTLTAADRPLSHCIAISAKCWSWTLILDCFIELGSENFVLEVIVSVTLVPANHCIFWNWKVLNHFVNVTTHDSHASEKTAAADQLQATVSQDYPDNVHVSK